MCVNSRLSQVANDILLSVQTCRCHHIHTSTPICPAVSVSLTTGLNNTLESNKLFSGQATKTNTSISGKFNNFAGLILPIKNM